VPEATPEADKRIVEHAKEVLERVIDELYGIHRDAVIAAITIARHANDVDSQVIRERLSTATDTWDRYLGFLVFLLEMAKKLLSGRGESRE